ncbi:hypothetical protein AB6A23_03065 [Paenibacillus tarimensis]
MNRRLPLALILFFLLLSACSSGVDSNLVTKHAEADNLRLTVISPKEVSSNEIFNVEVSLQNVGDESVELAYSDPLIDLYVLNESGEAVKSFASFANEASRTIAPEEIVDGQYPLTLPEAGSYEVNVRTSGLTVNGEPLEGIGNERYLEYVRSRNPNLSEKNIAHIQTAIMIEEPIIIKVD